MFRLLLFSLLSLGAALLPANAAEEREEIGRVRAALIHASNEAPTSEAVGQPADQKLAATLRAQPDLKFAHYRHLGSDEQALFRSYDNWLAPLGKSKQVLVKFGSRGRTDKGVRIDLQLWQKDKVILKADVDLEKGKPLYIRGPKWRNGYLLIAIHLSELKSK